MVVNWCPIFSTGNYKIKTKIDNQFLDLIFCKYEFFKLSEKNDIGEISVEGKFFVDFLGTFFHLRILKQ